MLRLDKVIKPWKESAALNDHINLDLFTWRRRSASFRILVRIFRLARTAG